MAWSFRSDTGVWGDWYFPLYQYCSSLSWNSSLKENENNVLFTWKQHQIQLERNRKTPSPFRRFCSVWWPTEFDRSGGSSWSCTADGNVFLQNPRLVWYFVGKLFKIHCLRIKAKILGEFGAYKYFWRRRRRITIQFVKMVECSLEEARNEMFEQSDEIPHPFSYSNQQIILQ